MAGKTTWLAASMLLVCNVPSQAAAQEHNAQQVARKGETRIAAKLNGVTVSARLLTHEVAIGSVYDQPPKHPTLNCTYSHVPCLLVDSLVISVGAHEVFVPRSAFGDLADIWTVNLHPVTRDRFGLTLVGGDASAAYEAEIVFDRHRVRERKITDSEAQMVSEKTTYFDVSRAFR
ncbi:MAG TPA: hypothetical protein VHY34_00510 [Caulobacteraceae bacterium]|jgi:hypothetical protein|nr:hypothetical protein [Caulobacteraceae bacterium]